MFRGALPVGVVLASTQVDPQHRIAHATTEKAERLMTNVIAVLPVAVNDTRLF